MSADFDPRDRDYTLNAVSFGDDAKRPDRRERSRDPRDEAFDVRHLEEQGLVQASR